MMLVILGVGQLVGRINYRVLLTVGWLLMAIGLAVLSTIKPGDAVMPIILGSTIQAVGAGMLYTPHSTLAFVTLAPRLRTEAAGLYSLLRQLGYASGVALMTATLQSRIDVNLADLSSGSSGGPRVFALQDLAGLLAYGDCFRMMAIASLILIPGIFLFRPPPIDRETR
jgi:DHA2 family multidrug resistance protein